MSFKNFCYDIHLVSRPFVFEVVSKRVVDFIHIPKNFPTQDFRLNILRGIKTGSANGYDKHKKWGVNENRKRLKNLKKKTRQNQTRWPEMIQLLNSLK